MFFLSLCGWRLEVWRYMFFLSQRDLESAGSIYVLTDSRAKPTGHVAYDAGSTRSSSLRHGQRSTY